jgi:hypothetical protein
MVSAMSSLRKRLSYANITATLALVFAMSGGAIAASHFVISSTKQISPKVRKQLKGAQGPAGAPGAPGAPGAAGAAGAPGSAVAYGTVIVNGVGNPTFTVNSGFSAVTEPQEGIFCITPVYAGRPLITSSVGAVGVASVSPQQCPGGYELESGAGQNGTGFSIMVP